MRKIRWCSYNSVAFHSPAWPRGPLAGAKKAKVIARTLDVNHCRWSDVLIIHGRCFGKRKRDFYNNRVLNELLSQWQYQNRPFIVYSQGNGDVGDLPEGCKSVLSDPITAWLGKDLHGV